ncbi:PqiC family protein [Collimonas silvisoli]|uniref:PqiC family protein n=1 Tax=Collimonas silvisoli TaxID=2825884 RepID=UPI001B8B4E02|nr:PqiC family protein [Collimonas silvisoli]
MITSVNLSAELLLAAAVLAGCASPEPRYYTLASAPMVGAAAPTTIQSKEPLSIEVPPVRVPERLNRSNLVLGNGHGKLRLMELDRWSAPLPDELRDALSQRLQTSLGAVDTYHQGRSGGTPVYRVTVEVARMDAELGARAGAIINWTVQRFPDRKATSGRTQGELPTPGEVDSVVAAYRQMTVNTADDIAAAIHTLQRIPLASQ